MTTQETSDVTFPAEAPTIQASVVKRKLSVDEIAEYFRRVGEDIVQIGKLSSQETLTVEQFLEVLKLYMQPFASSVPVSLKVLPIEYCAVKQANIHPDGQLELNFSDGRRELLNLSETKNRDLMLAVINDVMPKFDALAQEYIAARLRKAREPPQVEIPVAPPTPPVVPEPVIEEPLPPPVPTEEPPVALSEPVVEEPPVEPPVPDLLAERNAKIEAITTETLTYLDMLGGEVFEQAPVSKYFDDWMVNLRQVILSFESNPVIGADEGFNAQYNAIFGKIQEELDNRIAMEGDMAVSYRTLVENRYLLNKIDEEHAAQTKEFVEKGASNIETLMRSMANIEKELAEAKAVKVSYLHPMQMMAKDQKVNELTQKLNSVKRRLAMAVGTSSTEGGKSGDLDAQFEVQTKMLEEKRKIALELLNKNVNDLANEIAKLKMVKTSNPIKKVSIQQQVFELEQKLVDAKKSVELAEQNSSEEMKKLKEEFEKKKQAALGKVQTLEKDIATKAVDNSAGVRKDAAKALADAVKALSEKKIAEPLTKTASEAPLDTEKSS